VPARGEGDDPAGTLEIARLESMADRRKSVRQVALSALSALTLMTLGCTPFDLAMSVVEMGQAVCCFGCHTPEAMGRPAAAAHGVRPGCVRDAIEPPGQDDHGEWGHHGRYRLR
jgi:hypothetical protein